MTKKKPSKEREFKAESSRVGGSAVGGSAVGRSVNVKNGDFTGRDKIIGWGSKEAIKFMEAFSKVVAPKYRNPEQFTQASKKFKIYNETLSEWKGLHDGLDELLGKFGPFHMLIQSSREKPRKAIPKNLKAHWFEVSIKIDELLKFSRDIKIIYDEPFQEINGKGPDWAIDFYNFGKEMNSILEKAIIDGNPIYGNPDWWDKLVELTGKVYSKIISHLHTADKNLLVTAVDLYKLSERVFQRQEI